MGREDEMARKPQATSAGRRAGNALGGEPSAVRLKSLEDLWYARPHRGASRRDRFARSGKHWGPIQTLLLAAAAFTTVFIAGLFGPKLLQTTQVAAFSADVRRLADTPYYSNCSAAHAEGVYSIRMGEPGYRGPLDRDGDGVACEPYGGR